MTEKFAHISWLNRDHGHLGGVAKFAWLLREYVAPELDIIAESEFSASVGEIIPAVLPAPQQMEVVISCALERGRVDEETTVICDGFWGWGLPGKVKRVISVAHGTWLGNAIENERIPWDDAEALLYLADLQAEFWQDERVEIVAVSQQAAREVKLATGREVPVILNGVDTSIFSLPSHPPGETVIYVSDRPSKGSDIVEVLQEKREWLFMPLDATSGDLREEHNQWCRGYMALFPSRYEGCPYAWLEAMACGLPIVAHKVGLALDLPAECGEFVDDYHARAFEEALRQVFEGRERYWPRQWVEQHASIERWAERWREVLGL